MHSLSGHPTPRASTSLQSSPTNYPPNYSTYQSGYQPSDPYVHHGEPTASVFGFNQGGQNETQAFPWGPNVSNTATAPLQDFTVPPPVSPYSGTFDVFSANMSTMPLSDNKHNIYHFDQSATEEKLHPKILNELSPIKDRSPSPMTVDHQTSDQRNMSIEPDKKKRNPQRKVIEDKAADKRKAAINYHAKVLANRINALPENGLANQLNMAAEQMKSDGKRITQLEIDKRNLERQVVSLTRENRDFRSRQSQM